MHQVIVSMISRWNQNLFFKFVSSVKLAVPVMLLLIVAISAGTILESLHNAEYAKLALYNASWFNALLALLALNVFASMISRYPWKIKHVGFVVTHIGILTLLIGSAVTKIYGLDGSLQVQEGQSQGTVVLPQMMIGYQFDGSPTFTKLAFSKTLFDQDEGDLKFLNDQIGHVVRVLEFVPFAEVEKTYVSQEGEGGSVGISFGLKSQFFDVKEWLHSEDNPEMQLGPATLKLVLNSEEPPSPVVTPEAAKKPRQPQSEKNSLTILDFSSKKALKTLDLEKAKGGFEVQGKKIRIQKIYQRAMVADNKVAENEDPTAPVNPALELEIEYRGEKKREILYAKFPGFSLNADGVFGLAFEFAGDIPAVPQESGSLPAGHPKISQNEDVGVSASGAPAFVPGRNVIEFHIQDKNRESVRVVLKKEGQVVAEKTMKEGDVFETPWMGMKLFLGSISFGSQHQTQVKSVRPPPGKNLPPSALKIQPLGSTESFWLTQGEFKKVTIGGKSAFVVFSNETFQLPFELRLEQFTKKDYPGTETPYSYESLVTNIKTGEKSLISMNEPLKAEGFTLYQASFSLVPGQKPVSVLSVNRDPGRWIKYLGSFIMSLGIIIFTLMRSRYYRSL